MRKRTRVLRWGSLATALATTAALVVPTGPAAARSDGPEPASANKLAKATTSVTLVTGDTVRLESQPGGRKAVDFIPAKGREKVTFQQLEVDGELYVYPMDVLPYVGAKRLDTALFNITDLVADGYDNAQRSTIPLIVRYRDGVNAARSASIEGASNGPVLESVNARAVKAEKATAQRFWESLDDDRPRTASTPELAGGVVEIRLDRKVRASLDRSVRQIGAPDAWSAGFDGAGVKVAVLDTGADLAHPDLAGKIAASQSFVPGEEVQDGFGHGTHVASTIAGSGQASEGLRKGVAHGAGLVIGKVLSDEGSGEESWVIEGMEWAAASGAKVVNMSLGAGPTDGADLMSQALNDLTSRTGVLFVVSAGNAGPAPETVGAPGSADAALTVAAVDRDESIASFSSRGPRLGNQGLKPDISAPGVNIVAARAAGTNMGGGAVDEYYGAASGTSMAAPHVAGAAAILAQQHPDWTATELKDALVSTAQRNAELKVWDQGGGRTDLTRAVRQGVHSTGTLDLGTYQPANSQAQKDVSYTNTTDAPVQLALSLRLTGRDGRTTLPADAVELGSTTVDVPAGATTKVPVTVDPALIPAGHYSGYLQATGPNGVVVHTTLGLLKEAPRQKVNLSVVAEDGNPGHAVALMVFGEDRRYDVIGSLFGGPAEVELPAGPYYMLALMGFSNGDRDLHTVVHPRLMVTGPTDVTFDARTTKEVLVNTPRPAVQDGTWSYLFRREFAGRRISNFGNAFDITQRIHINPTAKVTDGEFEFGTRWSKIAPPLTTSISTPRNGGPVHLMYQAQSPAIDGTKTLELVDVGQGRPSDYAGKNVRGKIALVSGVEVGMEPDRATDAANAGAAMAAMIGLQGDAVYGRLDLANGDRLPTVATVLRYDEGERLRNQLAKGPVKLTLTGVPISSYLYDLMLTVNGQIPNQVVHNVNATNTATVTAQYREAGGEQWTKEQRFGWRPWQEAAINQTQRTVRTPMTRTEYVSSGSTWWKQQVSHQRIWSDSEPLFTGMSHLPVTYGAGQRVAETWWAPVVRPVIPRAMPHLQSTREGDVLQLRVPEFVDDSPTHYGYAEADMVGVPDNGLMRLYRNGELLTQDEWAWGNFAAGGTSGDYRLDLEVRRTSPHWQFSTRTATSWKFGSTRPASGKALLPLLQVDYRIGTDGWNRAAANRPAQVGLTVRHQTGLAGPKPAGVRLWATYDDGLTWTEARGMKLAADGTAVARVDHPALKKTNGYVGLRVQAWDAAGNTVTQTVNRAYGLR
ncbi:subtilase family protein [Kribbella amoyensis]|uniref:Subtilase family protein n=1 Tax=Kribbella amoyensis TaxID=996641 RepID=A0A561BTJ0_9ACTN|nr:S8 family serine peptidase [Kribbella amoyensis]TWD82207.1 subtilase family protein [Kribbella amoyensis]